MSFYGRKSNLYIEIHLAKIGHVILSADFAFQSEGEPVPSWLSFAVESNVCTQAKAVVMARWNGSVIAAH